MTCYSCNRCGKCDIGVPFGTCPLCGFQNDSNAIVCSACGFVLPALPGVTPSNTGDSSAA